MTPLAVDIRAPLDRFELKVAFETSARVTALFGASGAGKSSLLEVVAGVRPARGTLRFGDEVWLDEQRARRPEQRDVGWVPQDGLLFPRLSVRDNLLAGAPRARRDGRDIERSIAEVSEMLGLTTLLARAVETLSGGERQRVALGRALCSAPRLLLLDEPFGALDLPLRRGLLPYLKAVTEQFELPMLFVSHDPVEVELLAGDVLVLSEGSVLTRGQPRELLADFATRGLGSVEGYVNTLPCTIASTSPEATHLRIGEVELIARGSDRRRSGPALVEVAARDVLLSKDRPTGLSARNVLPARVLAVRDFGPARLLDAELAPSVTLRVELTEAAVAALSLEVGNRAFVIVKASACRVLGT